MAAFTARVLFYDANPAQPIDLLDAKLLARGYHSFRAADGAELFALAADEHPDVIIINTSSDADSDDLNNTLNELWMRRTTPVILIGERSDVERKAQSLNKGLVDYLPSEYRDVELFARLTGLVRINTMQEELERRIATAEEYGIKDTQKVSPEVEIDNVKVVVIGPNEDSNQQIVGQIGADRVVLSSTKTHEAMSALSRDTSHDALVISLDQPAKEFLLLCQDIRNNSQLYNLPIILVAPKDCYENPDEPYQSGVTDVVSTPTEGDELKNRVESLVGLQRYRWAMRQLYSDTMRPITSDGLTGLFSHGFLLENLAKQVAAAQQWHKNLTIGFFDINGLAQFNADYGYVAGDLLVRQIATMINGLLRGEDMSARYGRDSFVVVLPETPSEVADVALRRISSVIGSTEFAAGEIGEAVPVHLQVGVANCEAEDTAESLIARARAAKS